jgi:hypothetical protein
MNYGPELLLVGAVATVGVLHTMVPDHWVPITLIARQRGRSKSETARAALQAGIGHVLSTLLIALVVWLAGAAFAQRFGHIVDTVSSLARIALAAGLPFPHGVICESTAGTGTVIAMTFLISMEVRTTGVGEGSLQRKLTGSNPTRRQALTPNLSSGASKRFPHGSDLRDGGGGGGLF